MNDYEKDREARIARNKAALSALTAGLLLTPPVRDHAVHEPLAAADASVPQPPAYRGGGAGDSDSAMCAPSCPRWAAHGEPAALTPPPQRPRGGRRETPPARGRARAGVGAGAPLAASSGASDLPLPAPSASRGERACARERSLFVACTSSGARGPCAPAHLACRAQGMAPVTESGTEMGLRIQWAEEARVEAGKRRALREQLMAEARERGEGTCPLQLLVVQPLMPAFQ